jgi:hypothetical protein
MGVSKRSAARVEFPEDCGYVLRHPFQYGHHWSQPARAYKAGKAHIEINIGVRPRGLHEYAEHYVIRVRAAPRGDVLDRGTHAAGSGAQGGNAVPALLGPVCERCLMGNRYQQLKPLVLVGIGQAGEFGEGMKLTPVESLIRLERLEALDVGLPDVPEVPVAPEVLQSPDHGELDIHGLGPGGGPAEAGDRQLPHQMVKGTPQIVDGIPEDEWPLVSDLYHVVNAVDHGPLICFVLPAKGDQIRIWSAGFFDLGPKQVDVSYRVI